MGPVQTVSMSDRGGFREHRKRAASGLLSPAAFSACQ